METVFYCFKKLIFNFSLAFGFLLVSLHPQKIFKQNNNEHK